MAIEGANYPRAPATRRTVGAGLTAALALPFLPVSQAAGAAEAAGGDGAPAGREQGDDIILDRDLPIIDALHHLFIRPHQHYLVEDYLADATSGHRIVSSVYMQAGAFLRPDGPDALRGIGEVEFANGMAAMAASGQVGPVKACAAIVGHVDLRLGKDVGLFLDRAMTSAPERFRGVRQGANHSDAAAVMQLMPQQPPEGLYRDEAFRRGFAELDKRGLTFDAAAFHHQLADVGALADAFPNTPIILNHAGIALMLGRPAKDRKPIFEQWRAAMKDLARRPNLRCKIGGFGMPFWGFGFEKRSPRASHEELGSAWKPYVETVIDLYGADRCMMASNYPPDSASANFVTLWNALKFSVQGASATEKAAIFHRTAAKSYNINIDHLAGETT